MNWTLDYDPDLQPASDHLAVGVYDGSVLVTEGKVVHPYAQLASTSASYEAVIHLGSWQNRPCFCLVYRESPLTRLPEFNFARLRGQLGMVGDEAFLLAGRAQQLAHWFNNHRYCGRCAAPTQMHPRERARVCPRCETLFYPQIAPCIMALVVREGRCLLAHNARFPQGLYSVLAGFIEAGETAEQAVHREIKEEVGLEVTELRYIGSQSWPFPSQLMLGYLAYSHNGDICVDGEEILHADWFDIGTLPPVPPKETLSGKLIDLFVSGKLEAV